MLQLTPRFSFPRSESSTYRICTNKTGHIFNRNTTVYFWYTLRNRVFQKSFDQIKTSKAHLYHIRTTLCFNMAYKVIMLVELDVTTFAYSRSRQVILIGQKIIKQTGSGKKVCSFRYFIFIYTSYYKIFKM